MARPVTLFTIQWGDLSLEDICAIMGQTPAWAEGLLLRADGYVCDFYQKD